MRIGVMGSQNLKELLERVTGDKYLFIDLEPQRRFKFLLINRLYRIMYFIKKLKEVDIVYFIFIRPNSGFFAKIGNIAKKKVIYHWAGTDVLALCKGKFKVGTYHEKIDYQLSYALNLQQELREQGIETIFLPIVPDKMDMNCAKMPDEHAVLLSIPDDVPGRAEFYGYETMIKVIRAFPQVPFYITRSKHPELYKEDNVVFKGMVPLEEMNKLYDEISIIIRFPVHDGQSLVLMEGTIKGKYMIYNHNMPYTFHAESFEEVCSIMNQILEEKPTPQIEASNYGIENYNINKCREELHEVFEMMEASL